MKGISLTSITTLLIVMSNIFAQTDSLNVFWDKNPEPDLQQYIVYRSVNGTGNFQILQTTLHPDTHIADQSGIFPGNSYAYRVVAVDSTGNQSAFSQISSVGLPILSWSLDTISNNQTTIEPFSNFINDPDNNMTQLQVSISGENNVQVIVNGTQLEITPNPLTYVGLAGFTLQVSDPTGFWDQTTVQLTVTNPPPQVFLVHVPPIHFAEDTQYILCMDSCATTSPFTPNQLTWQFYDLDHLSLNYQSANRLATFTSAQPNWYGQDSVIAQATAPDQSVVYDTFLVLITPVNDPPVINWTINSINNNQTTSVPLSSFLSDPDHTISQLQLSLSNENNLQVSVNGSQLDMTPVPITYSGSAGFSLRVDDPAGLWDQINVQLTVQNTIPQVFQVHIPPIQFAEDTQYILWMDSCATTSPFTPDQLTWQFYDLDHLSLNYQSANRLATFTSAQSNWYGQDSVIAQATAPDQSVVYDTFLVTVTPVNDPPVINWTISSISNSTTTNVPLSTFLNDPDNLISQLQITISNENNLQANINGSNLSLTPTPLTYTGSAGFTLRADDPGGLWDQVNVQITVVPNTTQTFVVHVPDIIFPEDQQIILWMDSCVTVAPYTPNQIVWQFHDLDHISVNYQATNRLATFSNLQLNWNGQDTIIIQGTAPDQTTRFDTTVVIVSPVNDPPALSSFPQLSFPEDDSLMFLQSFLSLFVSDPDNPVNSLSWNFSGPGNVYVVLNSGILKFKALPDWFGQDSVTVLVSDGSLSDSAWIYFAIEPVNDAPVISGLPNQMICQNDSSINIDIYSHVEDVETVDSLLIYQFNLTNDSLQCSFNDTSGFLCLTANASIKGPAQLYITVADDSGASSCDTIDIQVNSSITGISGDLALNIPRDFILQQNYPNPFNPVTNIRFGIPKACQVKIELYNVVGQIVMTIINDYYTAGFHQVQVEGSNLASGFYIYRIQAADFQQVKKMLFIK